MGGWDGGLALPQSPFSSSTQLELLGLLTLDGPSQQGAEVTKVALRNCNPTTASTKDTGSCVPLPPAPHNHQLASPRPKLGPYKSYWVC